MRISDWSSDVCSSDLILGGDDQSLVIRQLEPAAANITPAAFAVPTLRQDEEVRLRKAEETIFEAPPIIDESGRCLDYSVDQRGLTWRRCYPVPFDQPKRESRRFLCPLRSEEHTS